ncbi:tRNA-dihydrouridine synthase [Pseudomonadales bacterium]|nr:tRNA-dihydrouridine synthase [Pseudomonadales bacterium]MDC1307825.1 tRNA-dihydrouridine synthase [Pseudomonadales bacterium]
MRLVLAPMEGVVDLHMRALLTSLGGLDGCVTEFVRVSNRQVLPERTFRKHCPELDTNSRTASGTPIKLQLLGGCPQTLADNARKAAELGAIAIDLNFGCPTKTVNNSNGGACLLQYPEQIYAIVDAVRRNVPPSIPVSAKIRLGFNDRSLFMENAQAVAAAGAFELTVHARSKADGYKPPAYWEYIGQIREALEIPVIANGEIWSPQDWQRCVDQTGCDDFMLGRGILARPDLALAIKAAAEHRDYVPMRWAQVSRLIWDYYIITKPLYPAKFLGNRVKQWLAYLRLNYPQAERLFDEIKKEKDATVFEQALLRQASEDCET